MHSGGGRSNASVWAENNLSFQLIPRRVEQEEEEGYERNVCPDRALSPRSRTAIATTSVLVRKVERKRTFGFFRKYPSSKTASGKGRFNRWRLWYSPVDGERKSGIPAEVEIPAPVRMTMFLATSSGYQLSSLDMRLGWEAPLPDLMSFAVWLKLDSPCSDLEDGVWSIPEADDYLRQ